MHRYTELTDRKRLRLSQEQIKIRKKIRENIKAGAQSIVRKRRRIERNGRKTVDEIAVLQVGVVRKS